MSLLARGKSILFIGGLTFFIIGVSTASVFSINLGGGSSGDNSGSIGSGIFDRTRTDSKGSEIAAVDNENEDLNKDKDLSYSEPNIDVNESFEEHVSGEARVDEEQNPENMSSSSRLINDDEILENQKEVGEASTKDLNDDDRETIGAVPEDNHIEKQESIPEDNEEEQSQAETEEFSQEDFMSGIDNALSEFLNGGSIDTFVQDIMGVVGNFMQGIFGQGSTLGIEESVEPQELPTLPDAVEPPQKTEEDKDSEQSDDDDESDDIDDGQGAGGTQVEEEAEEEQEEVVGEEETQEEEEGGGEQLEEEEEEQEQEQEQEEEEATYGDPNRTNFDLNNAETVEERKDILRDAALAAGMSESQARLFVAGAMVESSSLAFNRYDPHGADMNNESGKYGTDAQCFLPGNISIHMLRESGVDLSRDELLYISEHDAKRAAELSKQVMEHYDLVGDFSKDEALSSDYMHDIRNGYDSVARGIGEADDAFVGTYDIAWDGFDAPGRVAGSAPGQ